MANFTILSDKPFESYISFVQETLEIISHQKVRGLAVVVLPDEDGADVLTGYYGMDLKDKQEAASNIQADVTDGIIRANMRRYLEELDQEGEI